MYKVAKVFKEQSGEHGGLVLPESQPEAMKIIHRFKAKADAKRERTGCCGCHYTIEWRTLDRNGVEVERGSKRCCFGTKKECSGWQAVLVSEIWDFLQEGRARMSKEARGLISPNAIKAAQAFESTMKEVRAEVQQAEAAGEETVKSLIQAQGMYLAREAFTGEMIAIVRKMEGSPLGYKTDRDSTPNKYSDLEIRDALIEGRLRGFRFNGNEINVIGGNFYATQAGLNRVVHEHPGVANLRLSPGRPMCATLPGGKLDESTSLVSYIASFKFNPNWRDPSAEPAWRDEQIVCDQVRDAAGTVIRDERIPIKLNRGMGPDAVLGKARRKMLSRIYQFLESEQLAELPEPGQVDLGVLDGTFTSSVEVTS